MIDSIGRFTNETMGYNAGFRAGSGSIGGVAMPTIQITADGIVTGPDGAIDTTGTTTCGIQEAINALPAQTSVGANIGGGRIVLGPGTFNCTGQIKIPQTYPYNLVIQGAGEGATRVIYTGSTVQDFIVNLTGSENNTLNLVIRDLMFSYTHDTNKACLVHLNGANQALLENVFFTTTAMLSHTDFHNPLVYYQAPVNAVGVTGYRQDAGANRLTMRNCYFHGLAVGVYTGVDHSAFYDCIWSTCGQWNSGSGNNWGTQYGTTGSGSDKVFQNFASYGVGIVFAGSNYDQNLVNCQWFNCHAEFGTVAANQGSGSQVMIYNPFFEASGARWLASIDTNGSDDPQPVTILHGRSGASSGGDVIFKATDGTTPASLPSGNPLPILEVTMDQGHLTIAGNSGYGMVDLPAMTKAQRNNMDNLNIPPDDGALIYQTDNTPGPRFRVGGAWQKIVLVADP